MNHALTIRPKVAQSRVQTSKLRLNSAVCANEGSLRFLTTVLMMLSSKRTRPPTTKCFHRLRATDFFHRVFYGKKRMKLALRRLWRFIRKWVCNVLVWQHAEMRNRSTATRTWVSEAPGASFESGSATSVWGNTVR